MTIEQVEQIIKHGEGINIEFKEARNEIPLSFYDTVVSFANTDGGVILLGVDDGGNITGIDPKDISSIEKDLKKKIPSLGEKDTKLEPDFMALTKTLIQEYQKKIPSLDKKDTNLLSKRSYTLIKVLFLTVCPIKLQTLLEWNRYSFRKKFNDLYMQPLINIEFLSRTMPDKPNDPEQKYILTEKGKLFLSGQL